MTTDPDPRRKWLEYQGATRACTKEQPEHVCAYTQTCLEVILLQGTAIPFLECVTQSCPCVRPNMPSGNSLARHCDPIPRALEPTAKQQSLNVPGPS